MKKIFTLLVVWAIFTVCTFAQVKPDYIPEPIWFAMNDDFKSFEAYVKHGGNLEVSTDKGMTLPVALGYFSNQNFKKACSLLKSKKFNLDLPNDDNFSLLHYLCYACNLDKTKTLLKYKPDTERKTKSLELPPVLMVQYSRYMYYENQPTDIDAISEGFRIMDAILKDDWEKFKQSDITYGYFGNLPLLLFNSVLAFRPDTLAPTFFTFDLTEHREFLATEMETITLEKMTNFYSYFDLNPEISEYKDPEEIKNAIEAALNSKDKYILFALAGNHPVAPFQWISINGLEDEKIDANTLIKFSTPDKNFMPLEYRIKDLSFLITIKVQP